MQTAYAAVVAIGCRRSALIATTGLNVSEFVGYSTEVVYGDGLSK